MNPRQRSLVPNLVTALFLLLPLAAIAGPLPRSVEACAAPAAGKRTFAAGETLEYELDLYGVKLGSMSLETAAAAPALGKGALVLRARAQTDSLAENFRRFRGRATATVAPDLSPRHYSEEALDAASRRSMSADFPPQAGQMVMQFERDGQAATVTLPAGPAARDYLSIVYLVRTLNLAVGRTFCIQAVASRSVWRVAGKVVNRELVQTPAGEWQALHLSFDMVHVANPENRRVVHAWISDDPARIPLGAFGTVRGKPVRALLTRAAGLALPGKSARR